MSQYYNTRPPPPPPQTNAINPAENVADAPVLSEFDKLRETLLTADTEEGWASELRRYTSTMQRDVKKDTDLVEWWQVSSSSICHVLVFIVTPQNNATLYPTLARIALDVLPSQASSVPCERLFSGTKQIAVDRRARLGTAVFEELVVMGSAWGADIYDMAAWTGSQEEEVDYIDFEEMLANDSEMVPLEEEDDIEVVE
jgi:hAT family C-terminal dimerisation region